MTVHKLLVKDRNHTFEDNLVTFTTDIPASVQCSLCGNISAELLKVSCGRSYCQSCVNMLDNDGVIECCNDECTHGISETTICNEAFLEALLLTAMCPKEGCSFQGSLRDVMGHYKNCTSRTKRCTLCGEEVAQKLMSSHVADLCESRMLFCPYCEVEVEARNLESHMEDCDLRPASCTYCGEDFDTYAELRGEHLDVCPEKPVKCPYQRLGCKFQASNKEMESHLLSPAHGTLFMDRILKLEAQVQELRIENNSLKDSLRNVEDIQKEEEYLLINMSDNQEDLMKKISELQAGVMQTHPDVDARVTELETKNAILHEPLGKLLDEIAKLK